MGHLRSVLELSVDAPIERVCEDAARRIEELQGAVPSPSLHKPGAVADSKPPAADLAS